MLLLFFWVARVFSLACGAFRRLVLYPDGCAVSRFVLSFDLFQQVESYLDTCTGHTTRRDGVSDLDLSRTRAQR